jgi:hypothetical protein
MKGRFCLVVALALSSTALNACDGAAPAVTTNSQVSDDQYRFKPNPSRAHEPVNDPNAPTIRELKTKGLTNSGWDAEMYACGPACDAVYAYAVFIGRRGAPPEPVEHLYTCPNPGTFIAQDEWRCRTFRPSDAAPR